MICLQKLKKAKEKTERKIEKLFCVYKQNTNIHKGESYTHSTQPNHPYNKDINIHINRICTSRLLIPTDDIKTPSFHPQYIKALNPF